LSAGSVLIIQELTKTQVTKPNSHRNPFFGHMNRLKQETTQMNRLKLKETQLKPQEQQTK